ncbi:ABC transporter permease [Catellatospora citrea]|uniref:ABC transporter permease n=1 Tax=Catellatospora citrea TaxID=53366 RepID=A0A8J3NZ53_9ACTN|nr:peptide/nickel transport system permease protein [Catellatospora citrea]GIF97858.1 ABC transporter permease [Catellatospora citrea]
MSTAQRTGGGAARRRLRALTPRYVAGKVVGAAVLLLFVTIFNYFLFRVMPGDPAKTFAPRGRNDDPAALQAMRERMGQGKPWWEKFLLYLDNLAHGELEHSYSQHQPVVDAIAERFWPTVLLSGTALVLAAVIGMWLGARAGWRHGSRFDRATSATSLTWYSVPEWWLGLILIIVFASKSGLGLFPVSGMSDPRSDLPYWLDVAHHMVLPVTALTVVYIAQYTLVMRSSIIDERYADYLAAARAKGLRDDQVRNRHALRNALLPSLTQLFLSLGFVVSGAITIETVFSWPGLGLLSEQALSGPDYPLLEGVFLVFSAAVIVMNLIADLIYPLIDPRVRAA